MVVVLKVAPPLLFFSLRTLIVITQGNAAVLAKTVSPEAIDRGRSSQLSEPFGFGLEE